MLNMLLDPMGMSRGKVEAFEFRGGWIVEVSCSYSHLSGLEETCI